MEAKPTSSPSFIRIPNDLREELWKMAHNENRNFSNMILTLVGEAMKARRLTFLGTALGKKGGKQS